MSRTADCVTVTLPPDDIWRCHKPLVVAVLGVSLFTVWNTIRGGTLFPPIGPLVVVLPVWVVKDASILFCLILSVVLWRVLIERSRMRATVTARPEGVEFRDAGYDGLFARRPRYVPREKIASIDVGSYEKDDDDSSERHGIALRLWICIGTRTPKRACYFEARSPMELRWLASLLREVLGVPQGRPHDRNEWDVAWENTSGRAAGRLASSGPAPP
jgi:hypothetical protein